MKVPFPKNIKKGIMAGMTLNLGPISLSLIQLLVLAIGVGISLAIFNGVSKSSSTIMGVVFALPVFIIFLVFAFFNLSEMGMVEYILKLFRNNFFDTKKKFQINFNKFDNTKILIQESKLDEKKQKIEQKDDILGVNVLSDIEDGGLI